MKTRCICFVIALLATPSWAQISTDTCCGPVISRPRVDVPAYQGIWRVTAQLGAVKQYRSNNIDNSLFLNAGPIGTIAVDYYPLRHWGLGIQAGYFSFNIRPAYTELFNQDIRAQGLTIDQVGVLPTDDMRSFHLLAGPVLTLPLFRRLTLTAGGRAGIFYNAAPIGGAYRLDNGQLLFRFSESSQRFKPGISGFASIQYPITNQLQLGVGFRGLLSRLSYTLNGAQGAFYTFQRLLGGYAAFATATFTFRPRRTHQDVPIILPTCYAPVLSANDLTRYDVEKAQLPVFSWRSGTPIYATDEEFTFRLFSLPANRVILERTTREQQVNWPQTLKLPDSTSQFYYTIQSSRRDEAGQVCISPTTTGSLRFYKREAVVVAIPQEANSLTIDIFLIRSGQTVTSTQPARSSAQLSGRVPATRRRRIYHRKRTVAVPKRVAPLTPKLVLNEVLVYREVTRLKEVVWPVGIPYPAKPTLYRYVIRNEGDRKLVAEYTLLVTPGQPGQIRTISGQERDAFLKANK